MQKYINSFFYIIFFLSFSIFTINAQNFIVNGDFESGGNGVGFNINGAGYNEIIAPYSGNTAPGNYAFTTNPQPLNTVNFIAGGDHTSGSGKMMIIDGNTTGGQQRFWRAGNTGGGICGLTVGNTYNFSYWIKSVSITVTNFATRAEVGISFNNASNITLLSGSSYAQIPAVGWQKVEYSFKATNSCVNIELFNFNFGAVGNDFAIDDLSLVPPLALTFSITNPTCGNLNNGVITGYASGGLLPYTNFSLTGAATQSNNTGVFSGLAAGVYFISVTDFAGSIANQNTITLVSPSDLTVSGNTSICLGTPTTLTVSGSASGYTWTASPLDATLTTPNASNPTVNPAVTTVYTVTSTTNTVTNLAYNGNFAQGNVGFLTDYQYLISTTPAGDQRTYGITLNSNFWFPAFSSCIDHTSGAGNMMVFDGSTINGGNDRVWCQTIQVNPGQNYTFGYWVQTVALTNLANIEVLINGVSIGSALAPPTTCDWQQRTYMWNSGVSTSAQICIYDRTISSAGNDFALDDITFTRNIVCNLSKTLTVTVVNAITLNITNPTAVCLPATVNITLPAITAGSTAGTVLTYWSNAAATIPIALPNTASAINVSGTYYIKSTIGACSTIKPVIVTINAAGVVPVPTVVNTIYYCQNATAVALSATPAVGATLNWYGTNATGGTASLIAPIPLTLVVGTTNYYVSQTIGFCESSRVAIAVKIIADTGGTVSLFCDGANSTTTLTAFDWNNVTGYLGYNYSYSISGGPPVTGFQVSPSSFGVPVPGPGTSVTFTIVSVLGLPCVPSVSVTCNSTCVTNISPNFATIAPICSGSIAPILATTSPNGIVGTWSPSTINNLISGSYVFTPNLTLNPCATPQTLGVTVNPAPTPTFAVIPLSYCRNSVAPLLPTSSTNSPVITGTWSPAVINTSVLGTILYTFTPNAGQCVSSTIVTKSITIIANVTPNFAVIPAFCSGTTAPILATTSPNGITGTWTPAIVSNTVSGSYLFTPTVGQCATTQTLNVTIIPVLTSNFAAIPAFCLGTIAPILATTSPNGITGTWSPAIVSNTVASSYLFTPNPLLFPCAPTQTLTTIISPRITPTFSLITPVCQNAVAPVLPTSSTNVPPITGTWSPAVSTAIVGTTVYTFTPNTGQCVVSSPITLSITVLPLITPNFAAIPAFCSGTVAPLLSNTSPNGITGTWSPAIISNTVSGNYTFTPTLGQCAINKVLNVTIIPITTSNFATIPSICSGNTVPILATVSPNGISGTWSPTIISNTISGNYIFTPNPLLFPCVPNQSLSVTIIPRITPIFSLFAPLCQNAVAPILPTSSDNIPPITGTWSPAVSTAIIGNRTYTFTPTPGQCVSTTLTTLVLTVVPVVTPNFPLIPAFCSGTTAPLLSSTSPNGVEGTWSPSIISNTVSRSYLFTPNPDQCATTQTLNVTIIPRTLPDFPQIAPFCSGSVAPLLGLTSPNGISGTWSPTVIDNTLSGSYLFSPDSFECALPQTLLVTVNQPVQPDFPNISFCSGTTSPLLNAISPNGIMGTWLPASIDNINSGTYVFTPDISECAVFQSIDVTINEATLISIEAIVTNAFLDNQIITVIANAVGNYAYQLDNGPFQESNIFENVSSGTHIIRVKDLNGCAPSLTLDDVLVINYPKFFTPNGDGFNDFWNIYDLKEQSKSIISIFDRYGKLLKQISPRGIGWDGTFNGQALPGDDYWFSVDYQEISIPKTFKTHFSLKR